MNNFVKLILRIEKTRKRLYKAGHSGNTKKMLKISQELDLLINDYLKLKGEPTTLQENCLLTNSIHNIPGRNDVSCIS